MIISFSDQQNFVRKIAKMIQNVSQRKCVLTGNVSLVANRTVIAKKGLPVTRIFVIHLVD